LADAGAFHAVPQTATAKATVADRVFGQIQNGKNGGGANGSANGNGVSEKAVGGANGTGKPEKNGNGGAVGAQGSADEKRTHAEST